MDWTDELTAELSRRLRGDVRADPMTRAIYSTDASIYEATPLAVARPRSAEDLHAVVEFAAEAGVPLLPRGGGTSLEGQTVNEALVFDCSAHLDRVLEVNAEEGWARVQPGVVQDGLRHHVADLGLTFGPDTATANRATLGGMIGNNSAGSHSIVHGKTIDHVLELRCRLADGSEAVFGALDEAGWQAKQRAAGVEGALYRTVAAVADRNREAIRERYPKIMRRVSGYNLDEFVDGPPYNLSRLIVGSEGTLATVVEAKVRIVPLPEATALAVIQFEDLVEAMEATRRIVPTGPGAVELIDRLVIRQAREHPTLSRLCHFVEGDPAGALIVEYRGDGVEEVTDRVEELRRMLAGEGLGYGFHSAVDPGAQEDVWKVRKQGLTLMLSLKGDAKPIAFVEDTAVDVDRLPEYVRRLQEVVSGHDTWAGLYGHASVGCLHFRPVIDLKEGGDVAKLRSVAEEIRDLVMEFDGALSGEHGDGRARSEFLPAYYGEEIYRAFRQIKTAFDPEGRLNPGNICDPLGAQASDGPRELRIEGLEPRRAPIEAPSFRVDRDLRYGTGYRARDPGRHLDWSREGGFDRAVEMCNGNGHCRKVDSGTMCPSYMVTRDEEHSTRGRANALREIIAGRVAGESFTGHRLHEVLDLCLECKGCKGECPSNVDMAKMKYEFLAWYQEEHGTPLRSRLFAGIARASRWGSRLAPVSNWLLGRAPARWVAEAALGISRHRPMPPFASTTFEEWFRRRAGDGRSGGGKRARGTAGEGGGAVPDRGDVILFHDTFMNHNVPSVGRAAVAVLEATGHRVRLAGVGCCGRPMLSKGLIGDAREAARHNVRVLSEEVAAGVPVVACEPSCLSMLQEDYLDLLPDEPGVRELADAALSIDQYLCRLAAEDAGGTGARTDGDPAVGKAPTSPPRGLRLQPLERGLLVHGHCHQKATIGTGPTETMLGWIPGIEARVLDSGCCGMAGSFGYEAEHYDLSMAIGDRVLFPAVRSRPDAGVVVSGISCRQQVGHATGRAGRHPVEWLAEALDTDSAPS